MKRNILSSKKYYLLLMVILNVLFAVHIVNGATYYSRGTLAPNVTGSWRTNPDGSGSQPANFTTAGDIFVIQNGHSMAMSANWSVTGNIVINDGGTLTTGPRTITISGTTTIGSGTSGTLNINSTTGSKNFYGLVTINSGANWNNSVNETVTFRGGIANYGTFNAGTGTHTFNISAQTISGTISIPSVSVTGIILTNSGNLTVGTALTGTTGTLTNNGTLNIGGTCSIGTTSGGLNNSGTLNRTGTGSTTTPLARFINTGIINLSGSGSITGITNNAGGIVNLTNSGTITSFNNATPTSVLNIDDLTVPTITTLTATAAGNTVNYNGNGNQAVKASTYSNLVFSGSGEKIISTGTSITGNLSIAPSGTAKANMGNGLTINAGTLTIGNEGAVNGYWGSTAAISATYQDNNYFATTTGRVNVSVSSCTTPSAPTTANGYICVGSTASLSASGASSGLFYRWYDASSGGNPFKISTDNNDNTLTTPVLGSTTNYWVSISSPGRCESTRIQVTAIFPEVSADDRNRAGTDTWIGHVFKRSDSSPGAPSDANAFTNYFGTIQEPETFNESFVGTNSCLPLTATESARTIYTEYFAARFRMNSSKTGVYLADIGSDDGARLTVDGTLVYNQWVERGYVADALVLFTLSGSSNLLLEYYESTGGNQVSFQNLMKVPNNLTSGISQIICAATTGSQISANDAFTNSPISGNAAFTVTYQWQQAINSLGPWSDISGAITQNYTPAGFAPGTYYFRRKLTVSKTNPGNISVSATDFSTSATVTVNVASTAPTSITGTTTICSGGTTTLTASGGILGTGSTYQWGTGSTVGSNIIGGATSGSFTTPVLSTTTTYWVRRIDTSPCNTITDGVTATVTVRPVFNAGSIQTTGETICSGDDPGIIGSTSAAGGGDGAITYEWRADGISIPGTNSATYNPSAGLISTTTYTRWARDNACNISFTQSSGSWVVTVNSLPVITTQPSTLILCEGESGNIAVETTSPSPSYQWQYSSSSTGPWTIIDGVAGVSGHTSNQLALTNVPLIYSNFFVSCIITSNGCSILSDAVLLTVNPLPDTGEIIPD
jgi:hypothetical protein